MAQEDIIDGHVSSKQCQLAVDALLKHEQQRQEKLQESQLLPGKEQNVWLVLTVKQMHPEKKLKPHKIPIVHPLVDPRTSGVCLITKDPQREYKDLLEEHKIKFVSRVVGIEKLKGKWKPFEARRLLLKENDLFLADERVVPLLPKLLGKKFFEAKKQPIPVKLTRKDLKGELERAISSTYFHQNQGTCSSIKVGTLSQTSAQVLANLKTALPAVVKAVKDGWENIQSFHIKTNTSTSLPIWSCNLSSESGGRWAGLTDVAMADSEKEDGSESGGEESEEEVEKAKATKRSEKGKKRAAEEDEEEQPKKKVKAVPVVPEPPSASNPKKKRKDKTVEALPSKVSQPSTETKEPTSSEPAKKKKRKSQGAASTDSAIPSSSPTVPPSQATEPVDPTPATPSASKKKKKARAQATDFFDDAQTTPASTRIAPPPNTPVDGLVSATAQTPANPKKKRKDKTVEVEQTPVSEAIEKLAATEVVGPGPASSEAVNGGEDAPKGEDGQKHARKPRHKKNKASVTDVAAPKETEQAVAEETPVADGAVVAPVAEDGEKKKKRKKKAQVVEAAEAVDVPAATPAPATVSVDEVKQKLGASGVEKKKEKTKKAAKRSAKDAVLGKKGV